MQCPAGGSSGNSTALSCALGLIPAECEIEWDKSLSDVPDYINLLWAKGRCYKNKEVLLVASKENGLEVNADKTECCGKKAGKFHSIKTGRNPEIVTTFIYLRNTLKRLEQIGFNLLFKIILIRCTVRLLIFRTMPNKCTVN